MDYNQIVSIVGYIFGAGAIYGAIRADIKNIISDVADIKTISTNAHKRLDDHINGHLNQHSRG